MTQASQEPMLQTDCALATKQKMRDGSVEKMQERPRADLCDREWTVKCSRPDENDLVRVNTKRLATTHRICELQLLSLGSLAGDLPVLWQCAWQEWQLRQARGRGLALISPAGDQPR